MPRGVSMEISKFRSMGVTIGHVGDARMVLYRLVQGSPDRTVGAGTADGVCDNRQGHEAIAVRGADAVSPQREKARPCRPTRHRPKRREARNRIVAPPFGEE